MTAIAQSRPKSVNPEAVDIPGFPLIRRETIPLFTTPKIAWLVNGGERTDSDGHKTQRRPMTAEAARLWLTDKHARGWIDDEQLRLFLAGGALMTPSERLERVLSAIKQAPVVIVPTAKQAMGRG